MSAEDRLSSYTYDRFTSSSTISPSTSSTIRIASSGITAAPSPVSAFRYCTSREWAVW